MHKAVVLAFAMVLGAGLATSAVAARKMTVIKGTIVSVNQQANTMIVKEKKGDVTFQVAKDAKIWLGHKTIAESQLKSGEHVRVSYREMGQRRTAERIKVWGNQKAMNQKTGREKW